MPELLVDELTGDQVILAPARALRPNTFRAQDQPLPASDPACPFCPGNEAETPPEVARYGPGAPDTPGWTVRVVPNKFPVVGGTVHGAHEVVILSPAHDADFGALDSDAATHALSMLGDRARAHYEAGCAYVALFINHGRAAGASIEHPHAQLIALDTVPPRVQERLDRFTPERLAADQHHIVSDGAARVWCPRASTTPFAIRLALRETGARFDEIDAGSTSAVAVALRDTIARLHAVLGGAAYNVVIEQAPRDESGRFRWWIDIVPRVGVMAGFELGTGVWINIVDPADAAAALRAASA